MTSDAVFKVGRGGAGNYYTQQDAPVPAAGISQDQPQVQVHPSHSQTRMTGRGGAGNLAPDEPDAPAPAASSPGKEEESVAGPGSESAPPVVVRESHAVKMGRLSGRGGAGNWLDKPSAKDQEKQTNEEKNDMEKRVRETVDEGLRIPERTHNRIRRGDKA